jgi:hypothetical protein
MKCNSSRDLPGEWRVMTEEYIAKFPRKPADMSMREWDALMTALGPNPKCVRLEQGLCKTPCGLSPDGKTYSVQLDHVVPRSRDGATISANMQPLCDIPNAIKQAKPDRYWESSQFFFDGMPNQEKLRSGQIEFAWKPALRLAQAMLNHNADIYRVFLLLWWIVGGGKTISMVVLCSAINNVILHKGLPGTPRINKLLILTKESALRDSIAAELQDELVKYGIYNKSPVVKIVDKGDLWCLPGYVERADIVVACVHQVWEVNRDEPRTDEQLARVLSLFGAIAIDEPHFGPGQLERLKNLAPRALKFGFSNTPINDLGDILEHFVMFSMLDYKYARTKDDSLKSLVPFDEGIENGFYVPVVPEIHRTMVRGIEGDEQDGLHDDDSSIISRMNVCKAVIRRIQELDKVGRVEAPDDWFSSHALIRAADVKSAEDICKQVNTFLDENRREFPIEDGWRAVLVHGSMKGGAPEERRLIHQKSTRLEHPWMRAKSLPKGRCDALCARIMFVVDMAREGTNQPLCNTIAWLCPSVSLVELIQRIGRAMRAILGMRRDILERHQSVHLFWHAVHKDNGPSIQRAIDWMLNMPTFAKDMPTLDDLLEDGEIRNNMERGDVENVLTPEDKSQIEHAVGTKIIAGTPPDEIDVDEIINSPDIMTKPVSGERKRRAKDFIRTITSNSPEKERRVGVREKITPLSLICYERLKESYADEDLIRFIDTDMAYANLTDAAKADMKRDLSSSLYLRKLVEDQKRKNDAIFSMAAPKATQPLCGKGGVIFEIAGAYVERLKGLELPNELRPDECDDPSRIYRAKKGFLIRYVTRACHVILGEKPIKNGGYFDRIEYHTRLRHPKVDQTMFDLVRLQLMIDGHLPVVRAVYDSQVQDRIDRGMTLSDFERDLNAVSVDEYA